MKKRDLLDRLKTLYQANEEYGKVNTAVSADAQEGLAQCQETAIVLGNELEARGDCGKRLMHILEDYCESVYQLSLNLANEDIRGELVNKIRQQLLQVQDGIINGLPADKKEVAFFPYKASMWDSLESVWMAAKEDEECDTYVVPIPYFDKNPDGTFGEMHYEGTQFPAYVPVTDWQEYDLREKRPDVIYFHNPYDDDNYVTSVHPAYYSSELKKSTDKLVYIPYFINRMQTVREYCALKGVMNSDAVIVQSDDIRKEYIKYCREAAGADFPSRKILALGSPKFDKMIHIANNPLPVKEEWKCLSENKTVVLYNTHLNTLLKYGEQALLKIESVFQFFHDRDDTVLLWRPHPLTKTMLQAMKPALYEKYRILEEKYIREKTGIYDDSEDMYPALSLADAYYGDESSLVTVFGVTGKPICIQNVDVTEYPVNEKKGYLRFDGIYVGENDMYFADWDFGRLYRLDMQTRKIRQFGRFPKDESTYYREVSNIGMWNNKLWMLPRFSNQIYSYDMDTEAWETLPLPADVPLTKDKAVVFAGLQLGRFYYGFGVANFMVMKLDMETGEVSWSDRGRKQYEKLTAPDDVRGVCRQDCCLVDGKIYMASPRGNIVLEYDCEREETLCYQVGDEANVYITICHDGQYFWLSGNFPYVLRWQRDTGEIEKIDINILEYRQDGVYAFGTSLYAHGYVWLFAHMANVNIRINTETLEVEEVYRFLKEGIYIRVLKGWISRDKVYFMASAEYAIAEMDADANITWLPLYAEADGAFWTTYWKTKTAVAGMKGLYMESIDPYGRLDRFLKCIRQGYLGFDRLQQEAFLQYTAAPQGDAGERIHRAITGQ